MRKYAGELRISDIWTERPRRRAARSYRVIAIAPRRVCDHKAAAHDGLLSGQPGRDSRGTDVTWWKTRAKGSFAGLRVWRCLRPALSQSVGESPSYDHGYPHPGYVQAPAFMHRIDTDYAE
jgi:hypothetical protein